MLKGTHQSLEARKKMSLFRLGKPAWNKGLKMPQISEEKHWSWQGDKPSYRAVHLWLKKHFGNASYCSFNLTHKAKRFEWANISGSYLRDIDDYAQLCATCHHQYDDIRRGGGKR